MDTIRKLTLLVGAALLALSLVAGPAFAVDEATPQAAATEQDDEGGRIPLADSPRDRVGLILLGSLVAAGAFGWIGMRRQLKGERSQTDGEFRWR